MFEHALEAGAPRILGPRAAQFARTSLVVIDGVVSGRDSKRPIAEILQKHGQPTSEEVPVVVESLSRVLKEVGG